MSYLVEHTEYFNDYINAVQWAQDFSLENRRAMMETTLEAISCYLPPFTVTEMAVNCHHNYVTHEKHFGQNNILVTRKGAVSAKKNELGIIPGSMGTGSFIVRGKGNPESFCSCSHGAGRAMSRNQAEEHAKAMQGIEAGLMPRYY